MIPEEDGSNSQESDDFNRGIVLIVGFLPGLKADTIPLLRPKRVILLPLSNFLLIRVLIMIVLLIIHECPISNKHGKGKISSILNE